MSITTIVHIMNDEPIVGEIDQLPAAGEQVIVLSNPRRRDGKYVPFLDEDVTTIVIPWHRINFMQILPGAGAEEVIGFVRE